MSTIRVEIYADGIRYPDGQLVHPDDTVKFEVNNLPVNVTVDFETPCCFTSSDSFTLNSSPQATAPEAETETVSPSASPGLYYFHATIPETERKKFPNWEVKRGELEVPVDPPEEDKKRR